MEFDTNDDTNGNKKKNRTTGIVRDILDTAIDCFDPYHDCISERVDHALAALPVCVRESSTALAQCAMTNAPQCFASCIGSTWRGDGDGSGSSSPFDDLDVFDLFTCRGIERNLLQPMCGVMGCCEPCLTPMTRVMECVVNDVLDFGSFFGQRGDCTFSCDGTRRRRDVRHAVVAADHTTTRTTATTIPPSMHAAEQVYAKCFGRIPGLFGTYHPGTQLAARANFFDCIVEVSLGLYRDSETVATATTEVPPPPPTTTAATTAATTVAVTTTTGHEGGNDNDDAKTKQSDNEITEQRSTNDAPISAATMMGNHILAGMCTAFLCMASILV